MKKIAVLLNKNYKLLSVAAILEVFETVNKFYQMDNMPIPFDIRILALDDSISKNSAGSRL